MGENGISCCLFLHQTTTRRRNRTIRLSCMSFVSYIKPQLQPIFCKKLHVVYRSFPTSNHNITNNVSIIAQLYIVRFLHQTTTMMKCYLFFAALYIVRFLHQTTTLLRLLTLTRRCISFVSYIKPQLHATAHAH